MLIKHKEKEIEFKVVYYGIGLSGKTTNLEALEKMLPPENRSALLKLNTAEERTLLFDRIAIKGESINGYRLIAKAYTVPGQKVHTHTRRNVLKGADAVVFVADSRQSRLGENRAAIVELEEFLKEENLYLREMPYVLQLNKQDLPDKASDAQLLTLRFGTEPVQRAIATDNKGVMETIGKIFEQQAQHCRKHLEKGIY